MKSLILMLQEAGFSIGQIKDILNSPEELYDWQSKVDETKTTRNRPPKRGRSGCILAHIPQTKE